MKRCFLAFSIAVLVVLAGRAPAAAVLRVVASIPDLADVARHIGGDLVEVQSLSTGVEDIHAVPMKPLYAVTLNRADVLLVLGLEAEHAFIPGLLEAARNPKIMRDGPGYIDCSVYVRPLEIPTRIDRSLGDQHPMGNPHYNLDPVRMKDAARAIAEGLAKNDPAHEATYKQNLAAYLVTLDAAIARWQQEAAPLKGKKLVSYHPDMIYFAAVNNSCPGDAIATPLPSISITAAGLALGPYPSLGLPSSPILSTLQRIPRVTRSRYTSLLTT